MVKIHGHETVIKLKPDYRILANAVPISAFTLIRKSDVFDGLKFMVFRLPALLPLFVRTVISHRPVWCQAVLSLFGLKGQTASGIIAP